MRSKIAPTARAMLFVGYPPNNTHGFMVWDPKTRKVKVRYSLLFEEGVKLGFGLNPIEKPTLAMAEEEEEMIDEKPHQTLAIEEDGGEDDGWNQLYVTADEETLEDIASHIGVDAEEIQRHNAGVAGCNKRTGLMKVDTPMQEGTEIWIPNSSNESE